MGRDEGVGGKLPEREDTLHLSSLQIPECLVLAGRIKLVLFAPKGWELYRTEERDGVSDSANCKGMR